MAIGVAFLATPAKFLVDSLTLTTALEIGRRTFGIYNGVELALVFGLLVMAAASRWRGRWCLALSAPVAVVLAQTVWLIPALDARVSLILAGQTPAASSLHQIYIAAEGLKVLWLGVLGFGGVLAPRPAHAGRGPRMGAVRPVAAKCGA